MKLLVGLGNPGEKYENTRHNFGFMVIEQFLKDFESLKNTVWFLNEKVKSDIALIDWKPKVGPEERLILAKPKTYMNNSGMAVSLLASYYKIDPADIWIVYDELDLPLGTIKIRFGGAGAGHHGVESVMEALGTDKFWRYRLGIGVSHPHTGREAREDGKEHALSRQNIKDAQDFVLGKFGHNDQGKVRELIKHGSQALQMALEKGIDAAMNRYNTK
ncbi:MAG TPA: aminoacyl-tRNA hydrolase [Methylomirabilota bacterium]|nr:aminoacyl-tRNA hydrolase [Methylomirabilota bacterium]